MNHMLEQNMQWQPLNHGVNGRCTKNTGFKKDMSA